MIMTNKLLPVALVAALIGGSVGAFVMHSRNQTTTAPQATQATTQGTDAQYAQNQPNASGSEQYIPAEFNSASEQNAYKTGFADGFRSCESGATANGVNTSGLQYSQPRVVYRNSGRSYARSYSSRRVYYDYQRPRGRSFWQKHRDKLTVAMGTGGGALIGGFFGGQQGAANRGPCGAGGSAPSSLKPS